MGLTPVRVEERLRERFPAVPFERQTGIAVRDHTLYLPASQLVEVGYMPTYGLRKQVEALDETRQKFYLEMMDYFKDIEVLNWGPKPTECTNAFTAQYDLALLGKKPVEDAMKDAAKAINDLGNIS